MPADSASTRRRTCRESAPTQRSRASSRVRCATVTEIVMFTMNAPTRSATPPAISMILRTRSRSLVPVAEPVGGVADDQRAGHHSHADHRRDSGQRRARPPLAQPAQGPPARHGRHPLGRGLPSRRPPAVGEQEHAVGVPGGGRVVGHHHDGLARARPRAPQQAQQLGAGVRVEVAGRLVGEDDLRPADQRPRHRDPLLLAAGQLARPVPQPVGQADRVDHAPRPARGRAPAGQPQRQREFSRGGQRRQQVERLEHEPDPVPPQPGQLAVRRAGQVDVAQVHRARRPPCPVRPGSAAASTCPTRTGPPPSEPPSAPAPRTRCRALSPRSRRPGTAG